MNKFKSIDESKIKKVEDITKSIAKDIHILFSRRRYGAGAIVFRTFLLHMAYDYDMDVDVYGTFEKVVDYIINNMNILDSSAKYKLSLIREWCNNATHDVEHYGVTEEQALSIWSWVIALIEWNY